MTIQAKDRKGFPLKIIYNDLGSQGEAPSQKGFYRRVVKLSGIHRKYGSTDYAM